MADQEELKSQREVEFDEKLDKHLDSLAPGNEKENSPGSGPGSKEGDEQEKVSEKEEQPGTDDEKKTDDGKAVEKPEAKDVKKKDGPPGKPGDEAETISDESGKGEPGKGEKEELIELDEDKGATVDQINKALGTGFENIDELKSSLNNNELQKKLDQLKEDYNELKGKADPRQFFVNDEEYKRQLILKKYGQNVSPNLLNKIVSADIDKMGDVDVLVLDKVIRNPNIHGGEQGAREMILHKLGIDTEDVDNPSGWSDLQKNIVSDAAHQVRNALRKIRDIEIPEVKDFDAEREQARQEQQENEKQLKSGWQEKAAGIVDGFDKFSLFRDNDKGEKEKYFSFDVGDKFKKDIIPQVVDFFSKNSLEPSKENIEYAKDFMHDVFWKNYGDEIVQAYGKDVETRVKEEINRKRDNPAPPNRKEPDSSDKEKEERELAEFARGDKFKPGTLIK